MSMKQYVEHCFVTEKTIIGRICDALHDLVQFVQFKKRGKYPRKNVTRPATLRKLTLLHGCFSGFLNCTNGTKSRNSSHIKDIEVNDVLLLFQHSTVAPFAKPLG